MIHLLPCFVSLWLWCFQSEWWNINLLFMCSLTQYWSGVPQGFFFLFLSFFFFEATSLLYSYSTLKLIFKPSMWDFSGGPVVKNLPAASSIPGLGGIHMPQGNEAPVPKPLKPTHSRVHAPQQEAPPQWEAHTPQLGSSPLLQLEEARVQHQRPSTAKILVDFFN